MSTIPKNLEALRTKASKWHCVPHSPGEPEIQNSIGGTIAKSIMEVNKYSSQYQAYEYLVNNKSRKVDSLPAIIGSKLERPVIEIVKDNPDHFPQIEDKFCEFYDFTGWQFRNKDVEVPLSAHIDGIGKDQHGKNFLIEVKNYGTWAHNHYHEIEAQDNVQMQHYMFVLKEFFEVEYAYLFVRIDNNIKVFKVDSDRDQQKAQVSAYCKFWGENVIPKIEPDIAAVDIDFLKELDDPKDFADVQELSEEQEEQFDNLCSTYRYQTKRIKALKDERDLAKANLLMLCRGYVETNSSLFSFKNKLSQTRKPDPKKIKARGLWDELTTVSETTRVTVSEMKN